MKRLWILGLVILLLATLGAYAGGEKEKPAPSGAAAAPQPAQPQAPASKYSEAPAFAEMVKRRKLPPVDQRLPEKPKVVKPVDQIGEYGGTWHLVYLNRTDFGSFWDLGWEGLTSWVRDEPGTVVEPNLAESFQFSNNFKTVTMKLRKGLKWSDGEPFTTDDVWFWYEDIFMNDDLNPPAARAGSYLARNNVPGTITIVDSLTFTFNFSAPYPDLPKFLVFRGFPFAPKHYLKQFHPKYAGKDKIEKLAKDAGFDTWSKFFWDKVGIASYNRTSAGGINPDYPVLNAWMVTTPPGGRWVVERNPYYFKVDPKGNQLPYIDKITFDLVDNIDVANLKAIAGEIDMTFRYLDIKNLPLFEREGQKNGYQVLYWPTFSVDGVVLNENNKDLELRKIVQDVRFRQALSIAINRGEVISLLYSGRGTPRQDAPTKGTDFYSEKWEKGYLQFDSKQANAILDAMGLASRDKDGFRLRPDGQALAITIEGTIDRADLGQMIKKYWEDVGVKVAIKINDSTLMSVRQTAGDVDAVFGGCLSVWNLLFDPFYGFPISRNSPWAPLWGMWYETKGTGGEEPPQEVKDIQALYEQAQVAGPGEREKIEAKIIPFYEDTVRSIGIVGALPKIGIVKNNFGNVPKTALFGNQRGVGATNTEQYFIKSGK